MIVLSLLLLVLLPLTVSAQYPPDLSGRTVTVAVENAYPPFNYLDEEGNPVGWDYDVINAICEIVNCVPEFVQTSWDGMILAVSNGEFDMAADGITIKEDRAQIVDYSHGYVSLVQRMLVRIDEDRFATGEEFAAMEDPVIGVQPGTTNWYVATELVGEERVFSYDIFAVAIQSLISGDVDAVVMDDVAGQGYVGANPDSVRMLDSALTSLEWLGFIFPKGSELVDAFNAGLFELALSGQLQEITLSWMSPE
jgi:polar amino acid transport system substrate-binding protein